MENSSAPNTSKNEALLATSKPPLWNLTSKVRVVLRIRPFLASEIAGIGERNPIPCVFVLNPERGPHEEVTVHIKDQETSRNECYKLDSFFGQDGNVSQIFHQEVSPVIPAIFDGCNATVFAYGATGSGKTYTMQGTDEQPGLMPLAMSTILLMCESTGRSVKISYYEVYMDHCYDLLEPKLKEISVLEDHDGQVHLKGLSQVPIHSMSEFHEIFSSGIQRRKVAHTGLNDVSSRSHGILMIVVSSSCGNVIGKLNLIDLAGNEDNRRTCNEGIRLQESAKINQSLFALSNVIHALNNNEPRVPYRESKLTRILQDSLGGTSRALMVACLNPGSYQEAIHTVSLAARSRQIVNYISTQKQDTPKVKVDMEAKLHAWLESKGKTKSIQKFAPNSPLLHRTPASARSSLKKPISIQSSTKVSTNQKISNARGRKLFDSGAPITSAIEEGYSSNVPKDGDSCILNNDTSTQEVVDSRQHVDTMQENDGLNISNEKCCDSLVNSLHEDDLSNIMKCQESDVHKEDKESGDAGELNSSKYSLDESMEKEKMAAPSTFVGSPPISERIRALQSSLRKVLTPIHSNINMSPHEDSLLDNRVCVVLFEPRTPKTPYVFTYDNDTVETTGSALDKFNMQSAGVKSSLVREYLAFLNTASKEELLAIKGIGHKRAECILQLREKTPQPLKSLSDLQKIGLSVKQVNDLFGRMARGIFT